MMAVQNQTYKFEWEAILKVYLKTIYYSFEHMYLLLGVIVYRKDKIWLYPLKC